jgi:hypothetical protein
MVKDEEHRPSRAASFAAVGVMLFGALVFCVANKLETGLPMMREELPAMAFARIACRDAISDQMNDPESAVWGELTEWPVEDAGVAQVVVLAEYRGRNQFGALVIEQRRCLIGTAPPMVRVLRVGS